MTKILRQGAKSLCTILFFAASVPLWGQASANKGEITGTVFDQKKAVVPGAKITIKNQATGFQRETTTSDAGQFRAVLLDPGVYTVTIEKQGFAAATLEGVVVNVGSAVDLPVTLQVGSTTQSITVGETLLTIALPAPQTVLDSNAIVNLPINGRRFHDFATLTPTVQVDPQRGQLSFAGQRGIYANVMLDGADYNQPFFGGIRGGERSNSIITVPQSAVQEFQVVTTGYSAEYGRSTGGVLNTITKSGSNSFHGDAFYQIRHEKAGADNPILLVPSSERLQQFGGSVGGPVKKDKLFFFGAIEKQVSRTPRQVAFPALIGFTPTAENREAYEFFKSQEQGYKSTNNALAATVRGDYQLAGGHRLTLRYNVSDAKAENAVSVGGGLTFTTNRANSNDGTEKDRIHTGTAQYTHLISPSVINDVRFSGSYEERPRESNSLLPQVSGAVGVFGARDFLPNVQWDKRIQIVDGLSMTRSSHTLKFGADYNYVPTYQTFGRNISGSFTVSGSNVAQFLSILSTGPNKNRFDDRSVTYARQIGNLIADFQMHQLAFFGQDSWRVRPSLTLDFGVRWEGQFNPTPEANNTQVVGLLRGFRFPNGLSVDPTKIRDATNQFMPRLGFAWNPFGLDNPHRTVVRGHTGLFYASTPLLVMAGPTNNFRIPPGDVSIQLTATATQTVYEQLLAVGIDLNKYPLGQLPVIPVDKVQQASALALGGRPRDPYAGIGVIPMADDFRNPRAFQAGIGIDTEVTKSLLAGIQVNYVNTVHLLRNRDYNLPNPIIRPNDKSLRPFFGLRSGVPRPIPNLAAVTVRDSSARSMYRGYTLSTQYKGRKLQFGVYYTWSESFSDDDSERDASGFNYMDPSNLKLDYGYARMDVRHQFNSYAVYKLPFGFELSGILRARSGLPITAITGTDTNEELSNNDRPFVAPGVPMQRNSFRNRGVVTNNDLRILKNFNVHGERFRLQFSAEMFNVLNLDNVVYDRDNGGGINPGASGIFGTGVYGLGIDTNGNAVPRDPRFMRLRLDNGRYDPNNSQLGSPFQAQFGVRLFF